MGEHPGRYRAGRLLRLARSQFTLAWFDYELMTAACLTGFQALEAAFRVLYPDAEKTPFRTLIHRARSEGILPRDIAKHHPPLNR